MVAKTRTPPILTVTDPDGRTRDIYGLVPTERDTLFALLRRYYGWVVSGRDVDPWTSGVARASRWDVSPIKRHKPSGGYDAGRATMPERDAGLKALDAIITSLPVDQQTILWWWVKDRHPHHWIAERMDISPETHKDRWKRMVTRLYYRIAGL